jgi:hypothetical protein
MRRGDSGGMREAAARVLNPVRHVIGTNLSSGYDGMLSQYFKEMTLRPLQTGPSACLKHPPWRKLSVAAREALAGRSREAFPHQGDKVKILAADCADYADRVFFSAFRDSPETPRGGRTPCPPWLCGGFWATARGSEPKTEIEGRDPGQRSRGEGWTIS